MSARRSDESDDSGEPGEPPQRRRADYESEPLSRGEYIAAIVHLYRGELHRANSWRIRLDNTTNWAVLTTAGILTFTFGEEGHSHFVLLVGLAMITIFLAFEARRFRFADVWRARVRMIEENFYGPILRRDPVSPDHDWGLLVAEDLFHPHFKITRLTALSARLKRNYWPIYAVLISSWVLKILVHPRPAQSWPEVQVRLGLGILPWWGPVAYVGLFLVFGLLLLFTNSGASMTEADHWKDGPGKPDVPPIDL